MLPSNLSRRTLGALIALLSFSTLKAKSADLEARLARIEALLKK